GKSRPCSASAFKWCCCGTFDPCVPQERPGHYERWQVGARLRTHLDVGRPIKHPRWNLQRMQSGCSERQLPMNAEFPKLGTVRVRKPCVQRPSASFEP